MHSSSRWVLATAAAALLLTPAVAGAATKTVRMGPPEDASRTLQRQLSSDANAFFPRHTTIRLGDSVRFVPGGFHNADFPARGKTPTALLAPGETVTGATDAAGAPFWFNGQPQLGFSPALLVSAFGTTTTFDRAKGFNTGLPLADRPRPATLKFTRTGRHTFFCDVHPGMTGTVKVLPRRQAVPSARADARRVAQQAAAAIRVARRLNAADDRAKPTARTVYAGLVGAGGVEYFGFSPKAVDVKVGQTVTFAMPARSTEVHTATIGPGDIDQASSFLGGLAASFEAPAISPLATYRSEPPPGVATFTSGLHGNGFWNSGALDGVRASPLPDRDAVTFGQAGTFRFYCLIHPFMVATVKVT